MTLTQGLTRDQAALDQWYVLGALRDFPKGQTVATRLLGGAVTVTVSAPQAQDAVLREG